LRKALTYTAAEGPGDYRGGAPPAERIVQVGSQGIPVPMERKAKEMIRAGKGSAASP
jgi:hypothetical protein